MQQAQAQALIKKLGAAFPNIPLGAETVVLWASILAPLSFDTGRIATDSVIASCRRFPTVAEFNEALGGVREHQRTALPPPRPQPLTAHEREAGRARLASLRETVDGHKVSFPMPRVERNAKPIDRQQGRRYRVDPETGHAEAVR